MACANGDATRYRTSVSMAGKREGYEEARREELRDGAVPWAASSDLPATLAHRSLPPRARHALMRPNRRTPDLHTVEREYKIIGNF